MRRFGGSGEHIIDLDNLEHSQVLSSQFSPDAQAVLSDSRHNWTQMQYASVERIDDIMLFAESECANV
jgi:hypothetical protein